MNKIEVNEPRPAPFSSGQAGHTLHKTRNTTNRKREGHNFLIAFSALKIEFYSNCAKVQEG
jgi:hypothetical protein